MLSLSIEDFSLLICKLKEMGRNFAFKQHVCHIHSPWDLCVPIEEAGVCAGCRERLVGCSALKAFYEKKTCVFTRHLVHVFPKCTYTARPYTAVSCTRYFLVNHKFKGWVDVCT